MQKFTETVISELSKRDKLVYPVVEIYPRSVEDITSIGAPANAIGRFATGCFDWTNSTGTYRYEARILEFPEIQSYLTDQINSAEVKFGNASRGESSTARFVLDNKIKGCWMVIRLIFPNSPEDSVIAFWGKCGRPGEIDSTTLVLNATQDVGDMANQIPFRGYQVNCPLDFARPLGGCLGDQTLAEKSVSFRQAVATYGTSGCNKLFSTCTLLDNTRYFQGQRVTAVSGQFSYITVEEVIKRVLFWTKKKTVRTTKTDSWSSVNQSESDEIIPLAFGRCQIQGHPFTWADVGEQVRSFQGFCEGRISAFTFVRSRTEGINIVSITEHLGDWGGVGTQTLDVLFNGVSGYNSRLAYLEILTDGSSNTQVDDAPLITAVIRGLEMPVPDPTGLYTGYEWTNNPVHIIRYLLTDTRFGKIPVYRIDDEENLNTADECDSVVEDRTNDEAVVLPSNVADDYGVTFRRFRSSGRVSALQDMYNHGVSGFVAPDGSLNPIFPEFEDPQVQWFNPFEQYAIPQQQVILRQKYTFNGALQEKVSLLDFLTKKVLPTFKGYINYGSNGKIQIKTKKKADNGYLRDTVEFNANRIPISNVGPWRHDLSGYLLIGVSLQTAEIRETTAYEYSTACNGLPVTAVADGGMTATTSGTLSGGNRAAPALGWVQVTGTPVAGSTVTVTIDTGDNQFDVSYIADGIEDNASFCRMLMSFMNCHLQFQNYLTAYILPADPTKIMIRCEAGYLNLDRPVEYQHEAAEEVMRVLAVFENCGELSANQSAQFDNIMDNSFKWNTNNQDDINAVTATYTSAIDDFHLTKLMPRAAWDTIDLEGELVTKEIDLAFVDNYWQAAFLAKSEAIENIDGNLYMALDTSLLAMRLELGDVVAIRHDSGDGALNYTPVSITAVKPKLTDFKVSLEMKLYLSAAFDLHVQPIDVLLTTTLNPTLNPDITPPTVGTNGGVSTGSAPNIVRPGHDYYAQFNLSKYSPDGRDLV